MMHASRFNSFYILLIYNIPISASRGNCAKMGGLAVQCLRQSMAFMTLLHSAKLLGSTVQEHTGSNRTYSALTCAELELHKHTSQEFFPF